LGDIDEAAPRVERVDDLIAHLEAGCKPSNRWRVGVEYEQFGYSVTDNKPLPFQGNVSLSRFFEKMSRQYGWSPIREGEQTIGLFRERASISLEAGGQIEIASSPHPDVHACSAEVNRCLRECLSILEPMGAAVLPIGFSPAWSISDTPKMPKARYQIMFEYMKKVGRLGWDQLLRTGALQVSLDFSSEADMARKFKVALSLQPIVAALLANSPFAEGRKNGYLSYRNHVWSDVDPDRTGLLPFVFEDGFGFAQYVDYALDVPMYFVRRKGKYIDASGQSFRAFLSGNLPALPGERPTLQDFDDHLSTLFPEVRLKTYLEMRGADSGPIERLFALAALWVGLLYDENALGEATGLVSDWTWAERESLRRTVPTIGLDCPWRGGSVLSIAREVLEIARRGLMARNCKDHNGLGETQYLATLESIAKAGQPPAFDLLKAYDDEWGKSVWPVFSRERQRDEGRP
jgi:glutamate--cysteine ligase